MLLTPLWQVLVLQFLTNSSFLVLSTLVRRHDRSFVIHLLEPAINQCLYGDLHVLKKLATSTIVVELSLLKCTEWGKWAREGDQDKVNACCQGDLN